MSFLDVLNKDMDFASLAALARQGLSWWLDELAALAPQALRDRWSSRPRVWIEPRGEDWRVWRAGGSGEQRAHIGPSKARVGLVAPSEMVLVREIRVPRMSSGDVRQMIALDMERLSPLPPDMIHFDVDIVDRGDALRPQRVLLGIIERGDAARLVARARERRIVPAALAAAPAGDDVAPRFDFLPSVLAGGGVDAPGKARAYWLAAAGALVVINLGVFIGRDILETQRLRDAVEAQAPGVSAAQRLRQRLTTEDARRRDLLAKGARGDPLKVLDTLTRSMPRGAFLQRLEWNGQTLHLVGFQHANVDTAAAIAATGDFGPPKALSVPPPARATPFKPFDMTTVATGKVRP